MQIESRYAHRAAWWLTLVACCAVLIPRMCTPGCYVDGNLYALIARNLSIGIGSAWDPFGSPGCLPHFHEHPPLGLIMESWFFTVLGDHFWTEKLFSFVVWIATAACLTSLWRTVTARRLPHLVAWTWLPVLLWTIFVPRTPWMYQNVMLENPALLFALVAITALEGARTATPTRTVFAVLIAGSSLIVSLLCKGPFTAFPLTAVIVVALAERDGRGRAIVLAAAQFAVAGIALSLLLCNETIRTSLQQYWDGQLWPSLTGQRGGDNNGRMRLLASLPHHFTILTITTGLAWWSMRGRAGLPHWRSVALGWLFVALSASLPLLATARFSSHYLAPSVPFFAFAAAIVVAEAGSRRSALTWPTLRWAPAFGCAAFIGIAAWSWSWFGIPRREEVVFAQVEALAAHIPRGGHLILAQATGDRWPLYHYAYRQAFIACIAEGQSSDEAWKVDVSAANVQAPWQHVSDLPGGLILLNR